MIEIDRKHVFPCDHCCDNVQKDFSYNLQDRQDDVMKNKMAVVEAEGKLLECSLKVLKDKFFKIELN